MFSPGSYTVVLDASVLVPGFLSNFLLWMADADLFRAKWTDDIHQEWMRGRRKRYGHEQTVLDARRNVMDTGFPDSLVTDYDSLIDGLSLPDKDDRHVLAAAIKCGANAIVTSNLKHFPTHMLAPFNLVAISQDDFVLDQIYLTASTPRIVATAIIRHKKSLSKTRTTWRQYFDAMGNPGVGLRNTHAELTRKEFRALIEELLRTGDWRKE